MSNEPKFVLAVTHLFSGRSEEAASWASQSVQANPRFSFAYAILAASYVKMGRIDDARTVVRRIVELVPGATVKSFRMLEMLGPARFESIISSLRATGLPDARQ